MSRLFSTEVRLDKIRVNTVNTDAVILGSKIWECDWAKGPAEVYVITLGKLPEPGIMLR